MAKVIFYEKPGCINNTRQKQLLRQAGHEVEERNLLLTDWTVAQLRLFFAGLPLSEWFNRSAPSIKSGYITPETLDEADALALMMDEPLLIRRPLMQIGAAYFVGFDAAKIDALIGLSALPPEQDLESCPRSHA